MTLLAPDGKFFVLLSNVDLFHIGRVNPHWDELTLTDCQLVSQSMSRIKRGVFHDIHLCKACFTKDTLIKITVPDAYLSHYAPTTSF